MSSTVVAMNCATHPETEATAFCRSCGKAMCSECVRDERGVAYCGDCAPEQETDQPDALAVTEEAPYIPSAQVVAGMKPRATLPPPELPADAPSPFLAFVLGLIPGVGAVYNGHYAKAVFHVVVFGGVVTLIGSGALHGLEPLFVLFALMFFIYMPIEASRTAKALRRGESVDEFSGLLSLVHAGSRSPAVGIALIAFGVIFLLHSLGYWRIASLVPYWPVSLIVLGPTCSTGGLANLPGKTRQTIHAGLTRHLRPTRRALRSHASNPGYRALTDRLPAADSDGSVVSAGVRRVLHVWADVASVANRAGRRTGCRAPYKPGRGPKAGDLA